MRIMIIHIFTLESVISDFDFLQNLKCFTQDCMQILKRKKHYCLNENNIQKQAG